MKCMLIKLGVFLLLGAIVNVAVAWAIAYIVEYPHTAVLEEVRYADAPRVKHHVVLVARGFGCELLFGEEEGVYYRDSWRMPYASIVPPRRAWPTWSTIRSRSYDEYINAAFDEIGALIGEEACGWPVRSFSWQNRIHPDDASSRLQFGKVLGGMDLGGEKQHIRYPVVSNRTGARAFPAQRQLAPGAGDTDTQGNSRVMPCLPILGGIVFNTLFYAVVLWLFAIVVTSVRRWSRMRRGLCATCAYPIGTSPVCTECGKGLRLR